MLFTDFTQGFITVSTSTRNFENGLTFYQHEFLLRLIQERARLCIKVE